MTLVVIITFYEIENIILITLCVINKNEFKHEKYHNPGMGSAEIVRSDEKQAGRGCAWCL